MSRAIEQYLDRVMIYANRQGDDAARIRAELKDHLDEKIERLTAAGTPIEDAVFHAIEAQGHPRVVGYSLRPRFPWLDVRTHGTARGVVAIGPRAVGIFAFGGVAIGVVALGGLAIGAVGMGGLVAAAFYAWGGMALVPLGLAYAGIAIGLVAAGGIAIGLVAGGGIAAGFWATGGLAASLYSYETAPALLHHLVDFVPTAAGQFTLFFISIGIFLPALIVFNILCHRERRRIRHADPALVE